MNEAYRRWAWVAVLVVGVVLYLAVLRTLVDTRNPNFVPTTILLGATVVPATFLTFAAGRTGRWQVSAVTLLATAFFGGVIGVIVAGQLEYETLRELGGLALLGVAVIEECAKLIVPAVLLWPLWQRRRDPSDGLVIGVASGVGFAALETMGYGLVALILSQGQIGPAEEVLLIRGVLSPFGHAAWTGLVCAALWRAYYGERPWRTVAAAFAAAVLLHATWDSTDSTLVRLAVGTISGAVVAAQVRQVRVGRARVTSRPAA
jgi:RsiW-degrading membrane proteinase PrsW (M82 family)